jgi:hypothetical protein
MFSHLQPSVAFEAFIRQQDTLASMIDAGDENFSGLTVDDASFKNNLHRLHESTVRATVDETSPAENPAAGPAGEMAEPEKMKRPEGRLLTSSIYWYEPPGEAEDTRRLERTKRLLAPALKKAMDGKDRLPLDLWTRIAGELVHEYAICSLLNLEYTGNSQVSLADNIYATYVTIDGRKYVSRLTNSPGANNKLVINVKHRSPHDGLYIMEDHLGIRKVHISQNPPKYDDPKDRTTWWRVYPIGTYDGMLEFSSDVSPPFILLPFLHVLTTRRASNSRRFSATICSRTAHGRNLFLQWSSLTCRSFTWTGRCLSRDCCQSPSTKTTAQGTQFAGRGQRPRGRRAPCSRSTPTDLARASTSTMILFMMTRSCFGPTSL